MNNNNPSAENARPWYANKTLWISTFVMILLITFGAFFIWHALDVDESTESAKNNQKDVANNSANEENEAKVPSPSPEESPSQQAPTPIPTTKPVTVWQVSKLRDRIPYQPEEQPQEYIYVRHPADWQVDIYEEGDNMGSSGTMTLTSENSKMIINYASPIGFVETPYKKEDIAKYTITSMSHEVNEVRIDRLCTKEPSEEGEYYCMYTKILRGNDCMGPDGIIDPEAICSLEVFPTNVMWVKVHYPSDLTPEEEKEVLVTADDVAMNIEVK